MTKSTFLKVFFVLSFLPFIADCQPFTFDSSVTFGGKNNGGGAAKMTKDPLGNIYVVGEYQGTRDFGSVQLVSQGQTDIFVAKFDANGSCLWAVSGGGLSSACLSGGITYSLGSIYITGAFFGTYTMSGNTITSSGNYDVFTAQIDPFSGYAIWMHKSGGAQQDIGTGICPEIGGGFYLTGSFTSTATFGTNNVSINSGGFSNTNIFIAKFTSLGVCLWVQQAGNTSSIDRGMAITELASGYVAVTGFYEGPANFGSILLTPVIGADMFVAAYNPAGVVQWAKKGAGRGTDIPTAISKDASDNIYITGSIGDSAYFDGNLAPDNGYGSVITAKYNSGGTFQWVKWGNSPVSFDGGSDLATDASGSTYTVGVLSGNATFSGVPVIGAAGADGFIAKYSTTGALTWVTRNAAPFSNDIKAIVIPNTGGGYVYILGEYETTINLGSTTLSVTTPNQPQLFLTRLGGGTVGILEPWAAASFTTYPNPATELVNISLSQLNDLIISVDLLSSNGTIISSTPVSVENMSAKLSLDVKDLPSGNYLIMINTSEKVHSSRFVKI